MSAATWPACRHRGPMLATDRCRCLHPRILAPGGVTPATCAACVAGGRFADRPWSPRPPAAPAVVPLRRLPCDFLGTVVERTDARGQATTCPRKWIRRCEVHGRCTIDDAARALPRCLTCTDYAVDDER